MDYFSIAECAKLKHLKNSDTHHNASQPTNGTDYTKC